MTFIRSEFESGPVTPTLSGDATKFISNLYTLTISNLSSYSRPTFWCEVTDDSDGSVVVGNEDVTDNGDGTLSFTMPAETADLTVSVRAIQFGTRPSATGTKSVEAVGGPEYRYWRITGFSTDDPGVDDWRLYSQPGPGQGTVEYNPTDSEYGIRYPTSRLTSNTAPSPYVASASHAYSSYEAHEALDNSLFSGWWALGEDMPEAADVWLKIDLGQTRSIGSVWARPDGGNAGTFVLQGSDDDATWTTVSTTSLTSSSGTWLL